MIELEYDRRYLNQWGLNQRVQIDNFLPGTWVEFSNPNGPRNGTLITEAYAECGHVFANIPNVLLQDFGYLRVYVNPAPSDMAHTPEEKDYKICRQPKPGHYIYTETPTVSYSSKVDLFWGKEHAGKALIVGEDGYIKAAETTVDDSIATDEEINDMVEDVFDESEEPTDPEAPDSETPVPEIPDDAIATEEEVNNMVEEVFG